MFRPLFDLLIADHAQLAGLLEVITGDSGEVDLSAYHSFLAKLLKHISMEERILLPALEGAHRVSQETAAGVRRGHQALAALLASTPSARVVDRFRAVLADQDRLESAPGGVYEACEQLDEGVRSALFARIRSAPAVPVAPLRECGETMDRPGGRATEATRTTITARAPAKQRRR